MKKKQKKVLIRIIVSAVLLIACVIVTHFTTLPKWACALLYLVPYAVIGYDILIKAVKGVIRLQPFDENFLMAVATVGAFALGEYAEGAAVMLFYQTGELFQSIAVGKSRRSIASLMDIRPDSANLEGEDGSVSVVSPDEVEVGSIIVVRPGEKIPIDGVIAEGRSTLDTSALTGESIPREADVGDEVIGGCVNGAGVLRIRTTKAFGESTAAKILELVESAASRKSKSENFITKFARVYTPAVCGGALLLAVMPPCVRMICGMSADFVTWIYRALTFLVISCPCALVISIPLSFFASLGGASAAGILIKGSSFMETLSKVKTVVFDKTGTVTKGVFAVEGIHHGTLPDEALLEYAALAEMYSVHPIAAALSRAYGKTPDASRVSDVTEIGGHGVSAKVDGKDIAVGSTRLMEHFNIPCTDCHEVGTVVHIAIDGVYAGHILVNDIIKDGAKDAVSALKKAGILKTVMLTGDRDAVGKRVAEDIGIDEVYTELLPDGKVEKLEKLLAEGAEHSMTAFVGDGINDAPVIARADIGIAMGALGADAAIEAADVVIMDDDPGKIASAVKGAKKCMRIVYENIIFAIAVKVICLVLGAFGVTNMWAAIFADVGVMVIAVLNAVRNMRFAN